METYRVMVQWKCQSQITYVMASSEKAAVDVVNTHCDGERCAKPEKAYCMGVASAHMTPDLYEERSCGMRCGLLAMKGDVYCNGCRSAVEASADWESGAI